MNYSAVCKLVPLLGSVSILALSACSVNPATGRSQFDALMPSSSEASIGAEQHQEILKQYGGLYKDSRVQNYVSTIGRKVSANTERADVNYQFFVLDSPVVNAFALPGGYVYTTRGLLAVANDEAELAGVLGHEIGHVTARHSAARYSQGVLTGLGASILGAAVGSSALSQALGVGSNLYISSYSRSQENEADTLGIRYVRRAGYDAKSVSDFLAAMDGFQNAQENSSQKKGDDAASFFATHPKTGDRVAAAAAEAAKYQPGGERGRDAYLSVINGMPFGDSPDQGFAVGRNFYHPGLGFTFSVPNGYRIQNTPSQIVATSSAGGAVAVDAAHSSTSDMAAYIRNEWVKNNGASPQPVTINGRDAAMVATQGTANGQPVELRLVAINWGNGQVFRMQFAIPQGMSGAEQQGLKDTMYSFRALSRDEAGRVKAQRIEVISASPGDTVAAMAAKMAVDENPTALFLALNGLDNNAAIVPGQKYKLIRR